jgi:hypothetical protein
MSDFSSRLSRDLEISSDTVEKYYNFFNKIIRPKIDTKYLSHLVTTVEDLINEKRMIDVFEKAKENRGDTQHIKNLLASRNVRLYSIVLIPMDKIRRRATTRHHDNGASVYYNLHFEKKQIRILIAHELGHIINRELLNTTDGEASANLFSYIAMEDKNDFYKKRSKDYIFHSDLEILNEVLNVCVTPIER